MSFSSAVNPMNIGGKVAIVASDAPFLITKPFLQRLGTVLDLEQRQLSTSLESHWIWKNQRLVVV